MKIRVFFAHFILSQPYTYKYKMLTKRQKIAILLSFGFLCAISELHKKREFSRRWWIHPINQKRAKYGCFTILFKDLEKDEIKFKEFFR